MAIPKFNGEIFFGFSNFILLFRSSPNLKSEFSLPSLSKQLISVIFGSPLTFWSFCFLKSFKVVILKYRLTASAGSPINFISPFSKKITLSQNSFTVAKSWETKTMVASFLLNSWNLAKLFSWKEASPTAKTSSTSKISGSILIATEKAKRSCIPAE